MLFEKVYKVMKEHKADRGESLQKDMTGPQIVKLLEIRYVPDTGHGDRYKAKMQW